VATSRDIIWWENDDGAGTTWVEHPVDEDFDAAETVYSADVDGDGDMDVLGAARDADDITWWENVDGAGTSWVEHPVDEDFDGARAVLSMDVDGDGDMDMLGAAQYGDKITWWENMDGAGTSWVEHPVDEDFDGAWSVHAADVDGDACMDVLGAARTADDISWWDINSVQPSGMLESSILDTQMYPGWDYLEWSSDTPTGTSVGMQVRSSGDPGSMGAWSDTLFMPTMLTGILASGDRYMQYRVILETDDLEVTPVLYDIMVTWDDMGIEEGEVPDVLALLPISPNPSQTPSVRFSIPEPAAVDILVVDLTGRLVGQFQEAVYQSGYHNILLDELEPGIYFCRMISGDFTATQRFVVIE